MSNKFNISESIIEFKNLKMVEFKATVQEDMKSVNILQKNNFQRMHQHGIRIAQNQADLLAVLPLIAWINIEQLEVTFKYSQQPIPYKLTKKSLDLISGINFMTLKILDLNYSYCCNIQFLSTTCFPNLQKIQLNSCYIVSIKPFIKMTSPNLYAFKLKNNMIANPQILHRVNFHKRIANIDIQIAKNTKQWILKCPFEHINYFLCELSPQLSKNNQNLIKKQSAKINNAIMRKYINCSIL